MVTSAGWGACQARLFDAMTDADVEASARMVAAGRSTPWSTSALRTAGVRLGLSERLDALDALRHLGLEGSLVSIGGPGRRSSSAEGEQPS